MNVLANIAVFGLVGSLITVAVSGLVLLAAHRSGTVRVMVSAVSVAVLIAVPTMAAMNALAAGDGTGFGTAFLTAAGVLALVCAANLVAVPVMIRKAPSYREIRPRLSPAAALGGGGAVCGLLGLVTAGLALAVS